MLYNADFWILGFFCIFSPSSQNKPKPSAPRFRFIFYCGLVTTRFTETNDCSMTSSSPSSRNTSNLLLSPHATKTDAMSLMREKLLPFRLTTPTCRSSFGTLTHICYYYDWQINRSIIAHAAVALDTVSETRTVMSDADTEILQALF